MSNATPTLASSLESLRRTGVIAAPAAVGLIRVAGDDAATFLHTQLTNAVEDLSLDTRAAGRLLLAQGPPCKPAS